LSGKSKCSNLKNFGRKMFSVFSSAYIFVNILSV
jgi:hypothetical protein